MSSSLSLAFFFSILIFSTSYGANITVPLIHRDSVYSPLYNASETISDSAQRVVEASRGRHDYLSSLFSNDVRPHAKLTVGSNSFAFYLEISLGDPPLPQLVLMDTGSSFLWVKCKPCNEECKHSRGDPEIYDPSKSKTSYQLPCLVGCDECTGGWLYSRHCKYSIEYAGGRVSEGIYATEQLTLQTSNNHRSIVTLPNILFGCSRYTTIRNTDLDKHFSGIIGLGPDTDPAVELGYPPLVSNLGSKFSYCTGRISDRYYPYNQISFGDKTNLIGRSTPINIDTGNYFVHVVNISLGGKMLNIHPQVFVTMSLNKGILIDSGAELSYLPSRALDVVNAEVREVAAVRKWEEITTRTLKGLEPFELCYKGSMDIHAFGFPRLGYHFQGGAKLLVSRIGLFIQVYDDAFCFALQRTAYGGMAYVSIIGMLAQQGHNIGFDIKGKKMYLKRIHCSHLPATGK